MKTTSRFWLVTGLGGLLGLTAVFTGQSLFLIGSAGIYAWLSATYYSFVSDTRSVVSDLSITHGPDRQIAPPREQVEISVHASLSRKPKSPITIDVRPPSTFSVDATERTRYVLDRGEIDLAATYTAETAAAGVVEFPPVTVRFTDPTGLYEVQTRMGSDTSLRVGSHVSPRLKSRLTELLMTQGAAESKEQSVASGQDFAEVREYVSGDPARRIDWNATARFNRPYVTEFEPERAGQLSIIFDATGSSDAYDEESSTFEYARELALELIGMAQSQSLSVGLVAFDEAGIVINEAPARSKPAIHRVRHRLEQLREPAATGPEPDSEPLDPAEAHRRASLLDGGDIFEHRLSPFFADGGAYVRQFDTEPLPRTIRTVLKQRSKSGLTVVVTDTKNPLAVRNGVELLRDARNQTVVLLLETVDSTTDADDLIAELAAVSNVTPIAVSAVDFSSSSLSTAATAVTDR